jgi:anaerobic magnesium-protoporphyrin IX monomethyl ester cyclase
MKKLDLLLINPGCRELVYQALGTEFSAIEPPLWCRLIAGYVMDRGYSVDILDGETANKDTETIGREAVERGASLIAVVVFGHQPSASTQQMTGAAPLIRAIKKQDPEQKVILVGGHVAALPERTMEEEQVDFACNSEGPVTVHELLQALSAGSSADFSKVAGLVWREEGHLRQNIAPPLIKDLDADLHGNVWHLLPMPAYRAHNWQCFDDLSARKPYASIYTTLGCPYKCSFCCINAPFGVNRYRMREPEKVVGEIDFLYRTYGVKTFKIIDEMFVLNDRHVSGICERLAAKPYASELNFWAYARVDTVRPERLQLLRSAGIRWLALGIESGSAHVRDGAEKSLDAEDIVEIVRSIKDAGIYVIGNYIFGLPDDDLASMQQTLDLAKELNCEFANFYSAMAYPGSPLYTMAVNNRWALPERWSGFSQHSLDCTPLPTEKVTAAEVLRFRDEAFHNYFENPRYLNMVESKFGMETRRHIEGMSKMRLRRALLEDGTPAVLRMPQPDSANPFSIVGV